MPKPTLDQRRRYIAETDLDTGRLISEQYLRGKRFHRDPNEGPAHIGYADDGSVRFVEYYVNGRYHREGGPAHIEYGSNGMVLGESYSLLGHLHRDPNEGPAYWSRNEQGVVTCEFYIVNREFYRDPAAGPHTISRKDDGTVEREEFSKPGEKRPKARSEWRKAVAALRRPPSP
jgi:hypothetical protein